MKKNPSLYKGFMERQKEERLLAEQEARRARMDEEQARRGAKRVSYRGTAEICVASLFHGCGATYLSELLAVFLGGLRRGKACLVETKGLEEELSGAPMDVVTYPCDMSAVYRKQYDFLVRDVGTFDSLTKDGLTAFECADFKCVVAWPDEQSFKKLAGFMDSVEDAQSFLYFFNMVPKDRVSYVLDVMQDYRAVILPCTSLDKMDSGLVGRLYSVFGRG